MRPEPSVARASPPVLMSLLRLRQRVARASPPVPPENLSSNSSTVAASLGISASPPSLLLIRIQRLSSAGRRETAFCLPSPSSPSPASRERGKRVRLETTSTILPSGGVEILGAGVPARATLSVSTGGDARATGGERFPWVEIFRGLAILEVVFHHASGRFLSMLDREGVAWLILAILNRTLHYAVPAFLMMTAFVLALSLLREFRPTRYFGNRALRALLPYLLWSGLYLIYRFYAFGALPDWSRWADYLFWGKAYFHLYFLAVAMQLYLLLLLLLPAARLRLPFWAVLIGIVALTMAVYWANRFVYRVPYTGSYVLWYTPVILLGLWLATQANRLEEVLRRGWLFALLCASVGLWLYLPLALQALQGFPVNTFQYQTGNWLFTTGVSFLLLTVAYWLSQRGGWMVAGVQLLGRYSLQIYLLHPLILSELSRWSVSSALQARWGLPLFVALALLVPFAVGWLLSRAPRVSVAVFGRA